MERQPGITENVQQQENDNWRVITGSISEFHKTPHSEEEVKNFSGELALKYPESAERVAILAELPSFFEADSEMQHLQMASRMMSMLPPERRREISEKKRELIRQLTEFQFLVTHLVVANSEDRPYLGEFWRAAETMGKQEHSTGEMSKLKNSILSQAAIYQLLKELGKQPSISHPSEDQYYAVDLWTDNHEAIQVKGVPKYEQFEIAPVSEEVSFPGIALDEGGARRHFNSYISHEQQKMRTQLAKLERLENRKIEAYLMTIPANKRDGVTGKPSPEVVAEARKRMGLS